MGSNQFTNQTETKIVQTCTVYIYKAAMDDDKKWIDDAM